MEGYRTGIDILIKAMQDLHSFINESEEIKSKDIAHIRELVEHDTEDLEVVMVAIRDLLELAEQTAYVVGVIDGMRLADSK